MFDSVLLNERNAVIMFNFTALIASRAAWLQPRQEYNIQLGFLQRCGVENYRPVLNTQTDAATEANSRRNRCFIQAT